MTRWPHGPAANRSVYPYGLRLRAASHYQANISVLQHQHTNPAHCERLKSGISGNGIALYGNLLAAQYMLV